MTTPPPQGQNPFAPGQPQGQNPFAAQGQPAAQAPYPPQAGFPQQANFPPQGGPYAPVPPQQPSRKLSGKAIKNIVIVVIALGVAVGGWIASRNDADTAKVGDCMHRGSSSDTNPDLEVVKCSSADAQYTVLAKIKGSFSESEAQTKCEAAAKDFQYAYTETGDGDSFLLCLKDK